jgi:acyl-CoA synthetase (AMP-forming)/AMP-acid ligase II
MPFSPWPMPSVPDADLASFALRHAVRLADRPALIDDRIVTYGELAERVDRTARVLAGRDVVAFRLPNGTEFVVLLLAALRAGAAV